MTMQLAQAGLNLLVAGCLGAAIGLERQWRQRLAGLRTNALVALGAAIFVTYSRIVLDDQGAARMAAQVVSGIGFLGAGVIFKEGLNIRGPTPQRPSRAQRRSGSSPARGSRCSASSRRLSSSAQTPRCGRSSMPSIVSRSTRSRRSSTTSSR
jgi:MgtC family